MAKDESKSNTKWSSVDEATLVEVLLKEKRKGNWGDNNPKPTAYTAAELALAGSEKASGGGPKGIVAIKSRWQRLKQEFDTVKQLRGLSGFGWDDERSLVTASPEVWDAYIEKHPKAKPWRKKAFPLYDDMSELVDGSRATGEHVFRPGQKPSPVIDPVLLAESQSTQELFTGSDKGHSSDVTPDAPSTKSMTDKTLKPKEKKLKKRSQASRDSSSGSDSAKDDDDNPESKPRPQKTTGYERRKKRRISAGEGISTMANSMESAMAHLAAAIGGSSKTTMDSPTRKATAIAAIENDEGLSDTEFDDVVYMIMKSSDAATMYLAIKNAQARTRFLNSQLKEHRGQ